MKVLLIAGHGAGDSGAVGNGYKEADLTRKIVAAIEPKLKKYCSVGVYPTSRNAYDDVQNGTFANHVPGGIRSYNYVFEVHLNSSADDPDGNGVTTGTEIYITSAEEGYTVETAILKNVCSMGFRNRGVKRKDFSVIATCKNYGVSSALLESCFIDDQDDVDLLVPNIDKLAQKVVDGIAGGFGLKASSGSSTSTSPSKPSSSTGSGNSSSSSKKSISQVAKEVINGEWGNGDARKQKLEAAGYDYDAVQKEVNKQLGVSTSAGGGNTSSSSKKKTVTLPASASRWRVYPTNKAPVVGNECGYLYPSKFGGLTYEILATPQTDVATIQTRDYGKVNIYVAKSTGAIIK